VGIVFEFVQFMRLMVYMAQIVLPSDRLKGSRHLPRGKRFIVNVRRLRSAVTVCVSMLNLILGARFETSEYQGML
jgi:hypothetical protein